jgi:hypothetical protein
MWRRVTRLDMVNYLTHGFLVGEQRGRECAGGNCTLGRIGDHPLVSQSRGKEAKVIFASWSRSYNMPIRPCSVQGQKAPSKW